MLDCYRTGGANNPEVFVTAIAATLSRYPDQVIYDVTDPRSGLPAQLSWMPTIKDVREACDRAYEPIKQQIEREKRIAEQMATREAEEKARTVRPSLDDLRAKYGKDWGIAPVRPDKSLEERWANSAAELEKAIARVDAEYEREGLVKPSKFALSPTARRELAERDALREEFRQKAE